jgi:hypothetical protein
MCVILSSATPYEQAYFPACSAVEASIKERVYKYADNFGAPLRIFCVHFCLFEPLDAMQPPLNIRLKTCDWSRTGICFVTFAPAIEAEHPLNSTCRLRFVSSNPGNAQNRLELRASNIIKVYQGR